VRNTLLGEGIGHDVLLDFTHAEAARSAR
jgi:hypothetical protein